MDTTSTTEAIDQDRRRLLATAAVGVAAAGAASLLPLPAIAAAPSDAIRPFTVDFPEADLDDLRRRVAATRWPDKEDGLQTPRRACSSPPSRSSPPIGRRDYDWRKMRGPAQRPAAVHHRDRRARHPLHPCPLEARQCPADHRHPWLAGLDHRAAEDHRAAHQPDRPWRHRSRTRSTS